MPTSAASYVLTQFNSASLNRHISNTYRLDRFSGGFVEILAAEQTPDNPNWYQGTADAVRQAARHFTGLRGRLLPHSRRRPSVPDELRALIDAHKAAARRHHHRRSARGRRTRRRRWASSDSTATERSSPSRKSRSRPACRRSRAASPKAPRSPHTPTTQPFMASMGVYVFSRQILLDMLERESGDRFRPRAHSRRARHATR